ncbi:hypothetical protein TNCV_2724631 [Trichonephila clavipes]|nr:hypothetical protein TNCV_2724631 [Trichonephila clavipes]
MSLLPVAGLPCFSECRKCRLRLRAERVFEINGRGSIVVKVTDLWPACHEFEPSTTEDPPYWTATAGSDVVQSGRPIFDDFFQHLWQYIGNNMANVVFQMVKRLWLIRIDQ